MANNPSPGRQEFLIAYYGVLWDNINRHIQSVWQTVTTLGTSIALFGFVTNGLLPLWTAVTLIVGVCAWSSATVYDSALWFARNQAVATNVEKVFLDYPEDIKDVQPFFDKHRGKILISHFQIPLWLSRGLAIVAMALYVERGPHADGMPDKMPFLAAGIYVCVEVISYLNVRKSYDALLRSSPGREVALVETPPGTVR